MVQVNKEGLSFIGAHQSLQAYTVDISLLGKKVNIIKKNTGTLLDASNEVGVEANADETTYSRPFARIYEKIVV
jgi:hypothetical protein